MLNVSVEAVADSISSPPRLARLCPDDPSNCKSSSLLWTAQAEKGKKDIKKLVSRNFSRVSMSTRPPPSTEARPPKPF
jgi:hypothetical protein